MRPTAKTWRPDEMRLIACGTGMPTARPKQAASCWLLELGNGDKLLFDLGTGSAERIAAMQIPYNYLDKVFFEPPAYRPLRRFWMRLFIGGALAGRQKPLRVWGPAGDTPERGTKYALEHLFKALTWDRGRPRGPYRSARVPNVRDHRVRLQGRESGGLSGEWRDDSHHSRHPTPSTVR